MTITRVALQVLAITFALSCYADSNSIERAILMFPTISAWKFRPDEAVRCANVLITAGRESACAALARVANAKRDFPETDAVNEKVCHLCRLVFISPIPMKPLRPPALGSPELLPVCSMNGAEWPYMPFAIVNDVPISMTLGYTLDGIAETASSYLRYCMSNGMFRTRLFPEPTSLSATLALDEILRSAAWGALKWNDSGPGWSYMLDESYAEDVLWKQVENMAEKRVEGFAP